MSRSHLLGCALVVAAMLTLAAMPLARWLLLLVWACGTGVVYLFLLFAGLRLIEASAAGVLTVALPVGVLALSAAFLGEAIGAPHIIGNACAVAAILLMTCQPRLMPSRAQRHGHRPRPRTRSLA